VGFCVGMRHDSLERVQRIFIWMFLVGVLAIGFLVARTAGIGLPDASGVMPQGLVGAAWDQQVVLVSGHAGNDSGAVCEDENGQATIQEADINAKVAELAADRLRRAGADVMVLQEYDPRLEELSADVFLSIPADSCIEATGFKSTHYDRSAIPHITDRLVSCINAQYAAATGLTENVDTITEDMTEYHAFRQIDPRTPAAIIELGFLGGDHELLVHRPELVAKGVADGLLCFLEGEGQTQK
jgi:N-acetylmuramoyl-L-alanine amidase